MVREFWPFHAAFPDGKLDHAYHLQGELWWSRCMGNADADSISTTTSPGSRGKAIGNSTCITIAIGDDSTYLWAHGLVDGTPPDILL